VPDKTRRPAEHAALDRSIPGTNGGADPPDRRILLPLHRGGARAANGLLDGFVIWGDVAYRRCMFFSPDYWRTYFKPTVQRMIDFCHRRQLPVIYHGCGNASAILPDFIAMGLDAYNPLEAKADLDVVALRRQYGHRLASAATATSRSGRKAIRKESAARS